MANVIERIQDHLDPQSAANALYEVMLQWKKVDDDMRDQVRRDVNRIAARAKRDAYESVLSAFMGVNSDRVRPLLRSHFEVNNGE